MKCNEQVSESPLWNDREVEVHSIWSTIQGEGPFAGCPAVFVRLSGCNLQCPYCDTDYTSHRRLRGIPEVGEAISLVGKGRIPLVVITGGEPFRQARGLYELTRHLVHQRGFVVQIETNGICSDAESLTLMHQEFTTSWASMAPNPCIVCSPKTPVISPALVPLVYAWKYVLAAGQVSEEDGLPLHVLENKHRRPERPPRSLMDDDEAKMLRVWVQPMDEQNPMLNHGHLMAAVNSCRTYGYRLGIQIHKLIGVA